MDNLAVALLSLAASQTWSHFSKRTGLVLALGSDSIATIRVCEPLITRLKEDRENAARGENLRTLIDVSAGYILTPPQEKLREIFEFANAHVSDHLTAYFDDYAQFRERETRFRYVYAKLIECDSLQPSPNALVVGEFWNQLRSYIDQMLTHLVFLRREAFFLLRYALDTPYRGPARSSIFRSSQGEWKTREEFENALERAQTEALDDSSPPDR